MNTVLNKLKYLLPLTALFLFVVILQINLNGKFLQFTDSSTFIFKDEANREFGHLWDENNFGSLSLVEIANFYPRFISYLLLNMNLGINIVQSVMLFLSMSLIFYSSWYFQNKTLILLKVSSSEISSLVGSLFFTFNLPMLLYWVGGLGETMFLFFATAPIVFYLLVKIIIDKITTDRTIALGILFGITSNVVPFNIAFWGISFITLLILKFKVKTTLRFAKNYLWLLILFFTSLLVGLVFIIPIVSILLNPDKFASVNPFQSYIFSRYGISGMFKLYFFWAMDLSKNGDFFFPLRNHYVSNLVVTSTMIIWLYAIVSSFKNLSEKLAIKKFVIFCWLMTLLSILFAKGNQSPFSELNTIFYKYVPFSGIFRTPDTKFGFIVILALSFLVAFSYSNLKNHHRRILLLLVTIYIAGFFSTKSFIGSQSQQRSYFVPSEYSDLASEIHSSNIGGSVLILPGNRFVNSKYSHAGQDILGKMIDIPKLYPEEPSVPSKTVAVISNLLTNINYNNPGEYFIGHILIRKDAEDLVSKKKIAEVLNLIDLNPFLKKTYESDVAVLYTLASNKYLDPIISIKTQSGNFNYEVEKINPTRYRITINSNEINNFELIFKNNFSSLWKPVSKDNITMVNHSYYKDYANIWNLKLNEQREKPKMDVVVIDLILVTQEYLYLTGAISAFTLSFLLLYLKMRRK